MNSLIILAHPKKNSFTFAMAERYRSLAGDKGYQMEVIDLYREKHQQPFFSFDDAKNPVKTDAVQYFQDKITHADELVFFFPYWWGSMPAILKNFIDWNFSRGFGFEYVDSRPVGLLKGKTVKIYTTTGAPYLYYKLTGAHKRLRKMFQKQVVEFCGMKLTSFNIYGSLDKSATDTNEILKKIKL